LRKPGIDPFDGEAFEVVLLVHAPIESLNVTFDLPGVPHEAACPKRRIDRSVSVYRDPRPTRESTQEELFLRITRKMVEGGAAILMLRPLVANADKPPQHYFEEVDQQKDCKGNSQRDPIAALGFLGPPREKS